MEILDCSSRIVDSWFCNDSYTYDYWMLHWNYAPGGFIRTGGNRIELSPSNVYLTAPHTLRGYENKTPFCQVHIHFKLNGELASSVPGVYIMPADFMSENFSRVTSEKDPTAQILTIQSIILHYISHLPPGTFCSTKKNAPDPRICKAIEIINRRFHTDITVRSLSRRVEMSVNNFLRLFRKTTGTSPKLYIRRIRLEHADHLLAHSEKTITEIAKETGFSDRYHFSKAFKKFSGRSPGAFREAYWNPGKK